VDLGDLRGRIAFTSASATVNVADIMVLSLGGAGPLEPARITRSEVGELFLAPSWSPDGNRIAYQHSTLAQVAIDVMQADGSDQTLVVTEAAGAAWSPDGRELAISNLQPSKRGLALVDLDDIGAGRRQITTVGDLVPEEYPAWSPDGLRLAFNSHRAGTSDVWAADRDGSHLVNLTANPALEVSPSWSPAGTRIAFSSDRSAGGDVYLMDPDGSDLVRLTDDPAYDGGPVWSPDGRYLIFASRRGGGLGIWVMRADGSGETLLIDTPDEDLQMAWAP
jgi:Tol biopolymer transport system component